MSSWSVEAGAGQLAERSVKPGTYPMAVLAVRAPPPGQCWLLTDVIADCGPRGARPAEDVASQISGPAGP